MSRVVKSNIRPLTIKAPAEKLQAFEIHKLRSIALGESKRYLPVQVLEYENLKDISRSVPTSDIPMEEMSKTMTFHARLKARSLHSKLASRLNIIRQQT